MNNFGGINGNMLAQPAWASVQQQQNPYAQWNKPITPTNPGITWVNGWAGAQGYIIRPNSTVLLMDSERDIFYLKTSNEQGMATIRSFKFEECLDNFSNSDSLDKKLEKYVQKDEIQQMFAEFSKNIMESLTAASQAPAQPPTTNKYIERKEG